MIVEYNFSPNNNLSRAILACIALSWLQHICHLHLRMQGGESGKLVKSVTEQLGQSRGADPERLEA